jgi:hypothetical protein
MIYSTAVFHRNRRTAMGRTVAALTGIVLSSPPLVGAGQLDALLAVSPCRATIAAQLDRWGSVPASALLDPVGPTGVRSARVPTTTLGVWARVAVDGGGSSRLERVGIGVAEAFGLGPACELLPVPASPLAPTPAGGFDDHALSQVLAEGGRGVILWWSPHMPLSIDQYAVLRTVGTSYGLRIVPVLDPLADAALAERVVEGGRMPREAVRVAASIELGFRGMSTHAPSLLAFSEGRLDTAVMFGYRDEAAMRPVLQRLFVPADRKDSKNGFGRPR